ISFKAKPGETIAFIGSTGSGKSSLVQLIPRFYDVTLGKILVDGVDVRSYNLKALRQKIGFIPQKALLFTGTIAENLRYGKGNASREELV
ncbi:ATP-binding cassette domain-containing protein, partial [Corynebacterium aurimucosum]|nr:ATP-binding cassette domain-containing protein [Corynebacterium aurimucosum]